MLYRATDVRRTGIHNTIERVALVVRHQSRDRQYVSATVSLRDLNCKLTLKYTFTLIEFTLVAFLDSPPSKSTKRSL